MTTIADISRARQRRIPLFKGRHFPLSFGPGYFGPIPLARFPFPPGSFGPGTTPQRRGPGGIAIRGRLPAGVGEAAPSARVTRPAIRPGGGGLAGGPERTAGAGRSGSDQDAGSGIRRRACPSLLELALAPHPRLRGLSRSMPPVRVAPIWEGIGSSSSMPSEMNPVSTQSSMVQNRPAIPAGRTTISGNFSGPRPVLRLRRVQPGRRAWRGAGRSAMVTGRGWPARWCPRSCLTRRCPSRWWRSRRRGRTGRPARSSSGRTCCPR
jgi:hypothetical protein